MSECNRRYPEAWRSIDEFRVNRNDFGDWPSWCFCPLNGAAAIVDGAHLTDGRSRFGRDFSGKLVDPIGPLFEICQLGALAAWRVSQGVFVIDPTVLEAVMQTPVTGAIPVDVLLALPEWGCYIPTPGHSIEGRAVHGFFAHLDYNPRDGATQLCLLFDQADLAPMEGLRPDAVGLRRGLTFEANYELMVSEGIAEAKELGLSGDELDSLADRARNLGPARIGPLLSVLLYLCSETAEYRPGGLRATARPSNPSPTKTKGGWRFIPPDRPRIWTVGDEIGHTIRTATVRHRLDMDDRSGPRPHIRRAHWHSYWTGPHTGERKVVLKWLPPIPVALVEDTPEPSGKSRSIRHDGAHSGAHAPNALPLPATTLAAQVPSPDAA
jgi:hypothetical protein